MRRAGNKIGDAGAAALGDALKVNGGITTLCLSCEQRGAMLTMRLLGASVLSCTMQMHVRRADNKIGAAGAAALGDALKVNKAITTFYMSSELRGALLAVRLL